MVNYYQLFTCDERSNNFITLQDNLRGAPSVFSAYLDMICSQCHSVDKDAMFASKSGIAGGPVIKVSKKREFAEARDGFLCVKEKIVSLLQKHKVGGYQTRPIPYSDWHVLRISRKVAFKDFTPKRDKPPCSTCGRGAYYRIAESLDQISVPDEKNTFFTPEIERSQGQDIYLTEDVAQMLKSEGAVGASLHRLLDSEEYKLAIQGTPAARKKIKNRYIWLS
jgi:hypothetical protein